MENKKVKIIATIGPASSSIEVFSKMVEAGLDIVRFNFSWVDDETRMKQIEMIREVEKKYNKKIFLLQDLPGPRIQLDSSHTYDRTESSTINDEDKKHLAFGIKNNFDYVAASFVGSADDVISYKNAIKEFAGKIKLISKIERKIAVDNIDEIIAVSDAIMIARGDLGKEIPLEQIPFIQASIVAKTNIAKIPVIVATEMMLSMTNNSTPERAEVSDVADAIVEGTSAVMLSEETAIGKYPVEAVDMMNKIILESENHPNKKLTICFEDKCENIKKMGKLYVARHQESEWNEKGLWTGSRDIHLTPKGFELSEELGKLIKDVKFDYAFASMQVRSIETLTCILDEDCQYDVPTEHVSALNERSYGDYTGKNKWEVEKLIGEEEFEKLRRGWDYPVPNGETLKMVYDRVVPFYLEKILPLLKDGKNVLMVSHGNAIRALMKYIENISDEEIQNVEMIFCNILIYDVNENGHLLSKKICTLEK